MQTFASRKSGQILIVVCILFTCCYYTFIGIISPLNIISSRVRVSNEETNWENDSDIIIYSQLQTAPVKKNEITILLYTKYYGDDWSTIPVETLASQQCNHLKTSFSTYKRFTSNMFSIPCRITSDQKYFNDSDAIIFHSRDLKKTHNQLPTGYRSENQLWVYLQQESQIHTEPDLKKYSSLFNWTMTHRRDSDVYHPYGYLVPRSMNGNSTAHDLLTSTLTNKTGLVAWIVSHCNPNSKREFFVKELQKYITVDVFGKCGQPCPTSDCYGYVASKYKMYLSFENSLCTDYITEKFYKALQYNMLPIVYGGGESETGQDYLKVAPKGSYINTRSFNDAKDLANYILHLNKNDAEFLRYFEWKKKFQVVPLNNHNRWCNLCQKLYEHATKVPSQLQWYKDLWRWWNHVEETNEFKVTRNQMSSPSRWENSRNVTKACVLPPSKLIGTGVR